LRWHFEVKRLRHWNCCGQAPLADRFYYHSFVHLDRLLSGACARLSCFLRSADSKHIRLTHVQDVTTALNSPRLSCFPCFLASSPRPTRLRAFINPKWNCRWIRA
jgi:hypothetical protein